MPATTQPPSPTAPTRPRDEIARLGDEVYERDIRHKVEADHHGEVVAIDVDSDSWAIGDNVIAPALLMSGCSGSGTGRCIVLGVVPCGEPSDRGRGRHHPPRRHAATGQPHPEH